jgi:TolA-binding protein
MKQDQLARGAGEAVHWAEEHGRNLTIAGLVVVVLLALAVGGWFYMQHREDVASIDLYKAMRTFNAPIRAASQPAVTGEESYTSIRDRATEAQKKFQEVAKKYSYSDAAAISEYYLGLCARDQGDTPTAETRLKAVAAGRNKEIGSLADFSLASLYHATQKDEQAIAIYRRLIEQPTRSVSRSMAQLELAGIYETRQPEEARKIYEEMKKDDPDGPGATLATARLAELKK